MSFGLPLVALLTLSNANAPQSTHRALAAATSFRPDVVTSAGLDRSRAIAVSPQRELGRVSAVVGSVGRALSVRGFGPRDEDGGSVSLTPLPAPLSSMIERQVVVAIQRIGGLTRLLKVNEALMCTPGFDFEKRGVRVSIGFSGDLE